MSMVEQENCVSRCTHSIHCFSCWLLAKSLLILVPQLQEPSKYSPASLRWYDQILLPMLFSPAFQQKSSGSCFHYKVMCLEQSFASYAFFLSEHEFLSLGMFELGSLLCGLDAADSHFRDRHNLPLLHQSGGYWGRCLHYSPPCISSAFLI